MAQANSQIGGTIGDGRNERVLPPMGGPLTHHRNTGRFYLFLSSQRPVSNTVTHESYIQGYRTPQQVTTYFRVRRRGFVKD